MAPAAAVAPAAHRAHMTRRPRLTTVAAQLPACRRLASSYTWLWPASTNDGASSGSRGVLCRGFVGDSARPAGQYHSEDFAWEELIEAGQAAMERQHRELHQHLQQQQQQQQQQQEEEGHPCTPYADRLPEALQDQCDSKGGPLSSSDSGSSKSSSGNEHMSSSSGSEGYESDDSWERFHAQHSTARFFKEKRYLMLEFPCLALAHPPQHIAEIGCGCGSALLPVLKANPSCRVTACDISPTALQLFRRAAEQAGVQPDRINTLVLDAAAATGFKESVAGESSDSNSVSSGNSKSNGRSGGGSSPLEGLGADSLLLVFTLSALPPEAHATALGHAFAALRPGGLLLFRDYGLYDMSQLRFPGAQMLGSNLYRRSEGTLAYFFSLQALREAAAAAGFEEVECQYARVQMRNRKSGGEMRRVFIHGVFWRPALASS